MSTDLATWSIGALAEATAIAPATIRVWERRYGRPRPVRLPSGHRRYSDEDVTWLRRVAEALARGHRPARVVSLDDDALDVLLADRTADSERALAAGRYLNLVREYRDEELRRMLQMEIGLNGAHPFIKHTAAPLLELVGRAWADGDLEIRHEHFLTEILEDLLRGIREGTIVREGAPTVLFATFPGEAHGVGLQMAAAFAALAGMRASILGTDVPIPEILAAAHDAGATAVCISISLAQAGVATDRLLSELRQGLPDSIPLIAGGSGARGPRRGSRQVVYLETLDQFAEWLRS